jgi:hypothetical protein
VVGAGASKEVGLPVGGELRGSIAEALDIRYEDGYHRSSGDRGIDEAFRDIARETDSARPNINPYLEAAWRIRDAMPQAISIDNFIDSHRSDERIAICGKLAIARCILAAEASSRLFVSRRNASSRLNFANVEQTWFNAFFQLLTENSQESEVDGRLERVAIITFNYDRCIEHYLHAGLQNYYRMTPERARDALRHLQIFHPYGSVGLLPWQQGQGAIEFGADLGGRRLRESAQGLRTFTEGIDPARSDINEIRTTLREADRVAFLGFAFHRLNLALLFPRSADGEPTPGRPAFATGLGISKPDSLQIAQELANLRVVLPDNLHLRTDLTCGQLFKEYSRSLSFS